MAGKAEAIRFARENRAPFFGICFGLQCAVIEFARNVCGLAGADSTENRPDTPHPVIDLMQDQKAVEAKGATMRLGAYPCHVSEGTHAHKAYRESVVSERHRHRYEVNNQYRDRLAAKGMLFSGLSPSGQLVEMIELKDHPWFVATQFHPEFKSTPVKPHPLFGAFVNAAAAHNSRKQPKHNGTGTAPRSPKGHHTEA